MIRRTLLGGALGVALIGAAGAAQAAVTFNFGIDLGGPPQIVPVPGTSVEYAPDVGANYFVYGGRYYVYANQGWYVSPGYNGPWVALAPEYVPRPLLAVPSTYYRVPPPTWGRWRHEGPPNWDSRWGRRWEQRESPPWEYHRGTPEHRG